MPATDLRVTFTVISISIAAAGLFALQAGGFKCAGVILVEMIEEYEGVYSPSTLLWVFTIKWILCGFLGMSLFKKFQSLSFNCLMVT